MATKTTKPKNSPAPAKPETPAEESAQEAAKAVSLAAPQAETGNTPPSGTETVPPQGGATQDSPVPAKPETTAEESAQEAAKAVSLAAPQAETGVTSQSGTEAVSPQGEAAQGAPVAFEPELDVAPPVKPVPMITHLVVAARKDGFRRAGRAWTKAPTTVAIEEFSDEQIESLLDEPMLAIHFELR